MYHPDLFPSVFGSVFDKGKPPSGSIAIWGDFYGRPFETAYTIQDIRRHRNIMIIEFNGSISCTLKGPTEIVHGLDSFMVEDAESVLLTYYAHIMKQVHTLMDFQRINLDTVLINHTLQKHQKKTTGLPAFQLKYF